MRLPEIDEPHFFVLSEQRDVVLTAPNGLPQIAPGLLNTLAKLRSLRIVDVNSRQFLLDFLPGEHPASVFTELTGGATDGKQ